MNGQQNRYPERQKLSQSCLIVVPYHCRRPCRSSLRLRHLGRVMALQPRPGGRCIFLPVLRDIVDLAVVEISAMQRICPQCLHPFWPKRSNQLFCSRECSIKYHNRNRRKKEKKGQKDVECVCPKCGQRYFRSINWTGTTKTPVMYCSTCKFNLFGGGYGWDYSLREGLM